MAKKQLIIGCSGLAGIYNELDENDAIAAVTTALDLGLYLFDTAPHYGVGLSEERLGLGLHRWKEEHNGELPEGIQIWTKVGRVIENDSILEPSHPLHDSIEWGNVPGSPSCIFPASPLSRVPRLDYSANGAQRSIADSVLRLGQHVSIHGLRVHDCEDASRLSATVAEGGALQHLVQQRQRGGIREVSLGLNSAAVALNILQTAPVGSVDSVLVAGCWNLLEQDRQCLELFSYCSQHGIQVHLAGVFASGLLAGGNTYKYGAASEDIVHKTAMWQALCDRYDISLPAAAVAFCSLPPAVTSVVIGVKSASEVRQAKCWMDTASSVPRQLFLDAEEEGLLEGYALL